MQGLIKWVSFFRKGLFNKSLLYAVRTSRILAIKVVILFMVGTMLGMGGYTRNIAKNGSCIAPGVGIFMAGMILFLVVVSLDIASYILVQRATLDSSKTAVAVKKPVGIAMGESGAAKC
jgi:hypothetical protein